MNLKLYKHLKYTIYKQSLLKLNNKKNFTFIDEYTDTRKLDFPLINKKFEELKNTNKIFVKQVLSKAIYDLCEFEKIEKSIYVVYDYLFENSNIKNLVYLAKNNNIDSPIKIHNYYILVISKDNKNIKILDLSKNDNYEDVNLDSENIIENEDLIKKIETSPLSFI